MTTSDTLPKNRARRKVFTASLSAALTLSALAGASSPTALAAPNPYLQTSIVTTITPNDDGSYRVQTRESRELAREYKLGFGGGISDSFRLPADQVPDDADTDGFDPSGTAPVIPAYLTASYSLTSARLDNQPVELAFTRNRHRAQAIITGTYAEGAHVADFEYTVTNAAVTSSGKEGAHLEVHARLLTGPPISAKHIVLVNESKLADSLITGIDCVTYAPDRVPCGSQTEQGWTVDLGAVSDRSRTGDLVIIMAVD